MTKQARKPRPKRARGGVLMMISTMLIGSALLRFGVQAGPAIEQQTKSRDHPIEVPAPPDTSELSKQQTAESFQNVLAAMQNREKRLKERERALEDRLEALSIADAAIERKLEALVQAEESLQRTLTMAEGAAEKDLSQLTGVYEQMKPKDSAALFEEMAPNFAAGFLSRMKPEAAAAILAGLTPQSAYSISVVLAGRNAKVPTE